MRHDVVRASDWRVERLEDFGEKRCDELVQKRRKLTLMADCQTWSSQRRRNEPCTCG